MESHGMGKAFHLRPKNARPHAIHFDGYDGTPEERYQSRVEPQHQDGTRIDSILKKYATKGVDANNIAFFQGDVAKLPFGIQPDTDYQTQLNRVTQIKNYFDCLPSGLREKFNNSPANMLAYMANPKNLESCRKMGLLPTPQPAEGSARTPEKKAETTPPANQPSTTGGTKT